MSDKLPGNVDGEAAQQQRQQRQPASKSTPQHIRETHMRAEFPDWVAGLALRMEAAWKGGAPDDTVINIRLDDLLDLSLTWCDMRETLLDVQRKKREGNESRAMGVPEIPHLHCKPGRPVVMEEGKIYLTRCSVPNRVMDENAELFEKRPDYGV